jgi:hypothetical protein
MKRLLAVALLSLLLPGTALAASPAPTLTLDTAFAPPSGLARDDFTGGSENPYSVATFGGRIYVVGQTTFENKTTIALLARRGNGTYETGFGNGGKLILPIPGTETGSARDIAVLPDGRLRIAAVVDVDTTTNTNNDIALIGLLPDGSLDPAFGGGDGVATFGRFDGPSNAAVDDQPTRIALDASGRIAVSGSSKSSNVDDTLVALRAPDGSATGFGTDGMVKLDLAPATLADVATDIAFRPGGGLVAIVKRETDPDNAQNATGYVSALRAFNEDGSLATDFGAGGETALAVGEPDTNANALLERRGMLWVTGSTRVGVQTDGFLARVDANGNGFQFRRFDIRGNLDAAETVQTTPSTLGLLAGAPETLVAAGSAGYSQGSTFGAAAFNDLDGDVASMPYGDVVFGSSGGLANQLVGAAAYSDRSLAFVGLSIDSSLDSSFITGQLKLDADKVCDLAVDVPAPLEITYRGKTTPTVTLTVENKGKKACAGTVTIAAPFALGRAVTTGAVASGQKVTIAGVPVTSSVRRRADDVVRFTATADAEDSDPSNNVKSVRAIYAYCGLALDPVRPPAIVGSEGPRRVEVSLRNTGTISCTRVAMRVRGGSGGGISKPYTIERGKSVSDEVDVAAPKGAKIGRKVTLRVTAGSREGDTSAADTMALKLRVVGVGDSRVSGTGARAFSGTASSGRAGTKADRAGVRLRRVEVAVRALGKGCRWLSGKSARIVTKKLAKGASCRPQGWQSATGSSHWRLSLSRSLPAGSYELYTRAITANGFREALFSKSDGNRRSFRVS